MSDEVRTGVVGVGTMGQHHARVYNEFADATLVGVADTDTARATEVATEYGTTAYELATLLDRVDAVSVAVPTAHHAEVARECIDAGTSLLVEKPFVADAARGKQLVRAASAAGVTLQVGHIERFNPATEVLLDIVPDIEVISVSAKRLGPQLDRTIEDSAVTDLMIHDIDLVRALVGEPVRDVHVCGAAKGSYATATVKFASDVIGSLTASRVTQKKVRELKVTAASCYVTVDFIDQSVRIHRQSAPEYVEDDGGIRFRHESIVEKPAVDTGEPLKLELASFLESVRTDTRPRVTGHDGTKAVMLAQQIEAQAFGSRPPKESPVPNVTPE